LAELGPNEPQIVKLAEEIINRESGWQVKVCNAKQGCNAGQGLFQIIPSTLRNCEVGLERKLDVFNPVDNMDCGWWLLTKDGVAVGIGHWDDMSWKKGLPKKWGSGPYHLWKYGL
jgi:hypothetical protein